MSVDEPVGPDTQEIYGFIDPPLFDAPRVEWEAFLANLKAYRPCGQINDEIEFAERMLKVGPFGIGVEYACSYHSTHIG